LKYAPYIGLSAAILLILCCFVPLAYYPDLKENFTGFYSNQNVYGKPGFTLIFLSLLAIILFLSSKLWAKRVNHAVGVLLFAYALKTYILFSKCYFSICPQVKSGLIGILLFSGIILVSSLLSRGKMTVDN
jgi:threonine/homoserine efflux transporter RhtA